MANPKPKPETKPETKPEEQEVMVEPMTLALLQLRISVSKDKKANQGKFNYRTAEGILAAAKHELNGAGTIICVDDIVEIAGFLFLKSTATVTIGDDVNSAPGFARLADQLPGMNPPQVTGATSSYARKYALGGLLAIDDGSQDPDGIKNEKGNGSKNKPKDPPRDPADIRNTMKFAIGEQTTEEGLSELFRSNMFKSDYKQIPEPMQNEIRHARNAKLEGFKKNQEIPDSVEM